MRHTGLLAFAFALADVTLSLAYFPPEPVPAADAMASGDVAFVARVSEAHESSRSRGKVVVTTTLVLEECFYGRICADRTKPVALGYLATISAETLFELDLNVGREYLIVLHTRLEGRAGMIDSDVVGGTDHAYLVGENGAGYYGELGDTDALYLRSIWGGEFEKTSKSAIRERATVRRQALSSSDRKP